MNNPLPNLIFKMEFAPFDWALAVGKDPLDWWFLDIGPFLFAVYFG